MPTTVGGRDTTNNAPQSTSDACRKTCEYMLGGCRMADEVGDPQQVRALGVTSASVRIVAAFPHVAREAVSGMLSTLGSHAREDCKKGQSKLPG